MMVLDNIAAHKVQSFISFLVVCFYILAIVLDRSNQFLNLVSEIDTIVNKLFFQQFFQILIAIRKRIRKET